MQLIRTSEPRKEQLKEYVAFYYFMHSKENTQTNFVYYPHYNSALNLFFNSEVLFDDRVYHVKHVRENLIDAVVSCDRSSIKQARITGPYHLVGIVFKPLGIYHFIDVLELNPKREEEFKLDLSRYDGGNHLVESLFSQQEEEKKVELLDDFLIRSQRSFNMPKLAAIIDLIIQTDGMIQVQELERRFSVHRRTLLRWFQKYLFCSLTEMKNIVKFRKAVEQHQSSHHNLSVLAYESNYYDQSDFIKHFKTMTGEVPKRLLDYIKTQEEQSVFWKFTNI